MKATSTTHDSFSNRRRNAQPANTARPQLREVRSEPRSRIVQSERDDREHGDRGSEPAPVPERQRDQHEQQRHRDDHDRDEQDRGPEAEPREMRRDDEPGEHDHADGDERRDARRASVRRQRCPPVAEQLERVPEARLRRLLVERRVDVGRDERVDRRRELLELALGRLELARERELRPSSGTRAPARPSRRRASAARCAARGAGTAATRPRRRRRT